jgi:pimeloyl-ACP methyl ester carboxylesterase
MDTLKWANTSRLMRTLIVALTALASVFVLSGTASAGTSTSGVVGTAPKPTIVLVHGAFADASGWTGTTKRLQDRGYTVIAPANPLRGVSSDSAYIASVLATISGPIVLVGHSYGGDVITNAATGDPNVKALVYIAAFAPDAGETVGGLTAMFPGSMLTPQNLIIVPFPGGAEGYINPSVFRAAFAADVPPDLAAVMGASQRPASVVTLGEPSGIPAWKTIPSWYMVARNDRTIPPALERFFAARMHAHTVEIASSHAAMVSHPEAVTDLILNAAQDGE